MKLLLYISIEKYICRISICILKKRKKRKQTVQICNFKVCEIQIWPHKSKNCIRFCCSRYRSIEEGKKKFRKQKVKAFTQILINVRNFSVLLRLKTLQLQFETHQQAKVFICVCLCCQLLQAPMAITAISNSSIESGFSSAQHKNMKLVAAGGKKPKRCNSRGVRIVGSRIYDSDNGKTCHQVHFFFFLFCVFLSSRDDRSFFSVFFVLWGVWGLWSLRNLNVGV